jgi:hypothetical protein
MRKIERQMCDAIRDSKDWKSGNTEVFHVDGAARVFLHNNLIAVVTDDDVRIFDGGWQSNTTKSRLNAICDAFCIAGEGVFQHKFAWFIRKFVGQHGVEKVFTTMPFVNGYVFA